MKFCFFLCCISILAPLLGAEDIPVLFEVEGRYEEYGTQAGRLSTEYGAFSSYIAVRRGFDGGCSFFGGLALPCAALGSVSLRGPLQELIKPGALTASSAKYSDSPSFSLQRGWSACSRRSFVLGIPGTCQFSVLEGEGDLPELGLEAECSPFSWLRCAAVCAFAEVPEDQDDEWIQEDGLPAYGRFLLMGLRLLVRGEHAGISCFAGTSLHRIYPGGAYLRGSFLYDSSLLSTRFTVSRLDRNFRSPRHSTSPYFLSSALDLFILPVFPVKGLVRSSATLEHPHLYGTETADLRLNLEGGAAWTLSRYSGEITRELLVRREEGQLSWEESASGRISVALPPLFRGCTARVFTLGSYLFGYNVLEKASAGVSLRRLPVYVSFSAGFAVEREICEPPKERYNFLDFDLSLMFDDWYVKAGFSTEGESGSFSVSGGRSFRISM